MNNMYEINEKIKEIAKQCLKEKWYKPESRLNEPCAFCDECKSCSVCLCPHDLCNGCKKDDEEDLFSKIWGSITGKDFRIKNADQDLVQQLIKRLEEIGEINV